MSPTVSFELLLTTSLVYAYEGKYLANFDVPGAYIQAEMTNNGKILMKLRGGFLDIMCSMNTEPIILKM